MNSANKVILLGTLGADPELRYIRTTGTAVCEMRLATNRRWTDKDGIKQTRTDWIRLKVFGRQAENCKEYLGKGRHIYVEGRLETSSYEDRDGVKRVKAEVVANQVIFLSSQGQRSAAPEAEASPPESSYEQHESFGAGAAGLGLDPASSPSVEPIPAGGYSSGGPPAAHYPASEPVAAQPRADDSVPF